MNYKPLGDLVKVKGGKRLPKGGNLQITPNSHPYIRVRDMGDRYIPRTGLEFVPDEIFPKISRYIVNKNDLIISIVGTIGMVSIIDKYFDGASQTENCAKLTGLDFVDVNFLYYYLRSEKGQQEIHKGTVGAVQAKLPLYNIEKIEVYWPERIERARVVKLLSTLDDKLEINRQTNQTLEQLAQAIFKSWFVDFDPVKAKIAVLEAGGTAEQAELAAMSAISAKDEAALKKLQAEQPEAYAELAQTAALFPSKMVDSELGEIPEGWEVTKVEHLLTRLKPKRTFTKKQVEPYGLVPVFEQGAGILLGFHNDEAGFRATPEEPIFIFGDHTCILHLSCTGFDISSNVIPLKGGIRPTAWTFYAILGKQTFQEYRRHWSEFIVKESILPTINVTERFSEIVTTFNLKKEAFEKEIAALKQVRDSLLPKLLSGELPIPEPSEATA